ncbi:MAG: prolyl oligopeptidase family serine peptidase [Gemmataceae bacterium]|nr:prolyl oligopeptidase family serine peptidase [Gemmataceae bacterium]
MFPFSDNGGSQKPTSPLTRRVYKDAQDKTLPYRLLAPEQIEPGQTYPLVLFLHGGGERGDDNERQLAHGVPEFASAANRQKYPCFLAAPQCPAGSRWVEVDWTADSHKQPERPSEPLRLALELIEALCEELPIDRGRIYITGLSMGGYGVWDALSRRPELFAAGVPVCGGGDEALAERIAEVPVWAFHGARDGVVKPARSRNMIEALKQAGGSPTYTEYPDVGHNSWVRAYRDPELFRWLFSQKRA